MPAPTLVAGLPTTTRTGRAGARPRCACASRIRIVRSARRRCGRRVRRRPHRPRRFVAPVPPTAGPAGPPRPATAGPVRCLRARRFLEALDLCRRSRSVRRCRSPGQLQPTCQHRPRSGVVGPAVARSVASAAAGMVQPGQRPGPPRPRPPQRPGMPSAPAGHRPPGGRIAAVATRIERPGGAGSGGSAADHPHHHARRGHDRQGPGRQARGQGQGRHRKILRSG